VPGGLIFRKYLHWVHEGQWPASLGDFMKSSAGRNGAENRGWCLAMVDKKSKVTFVCVNDVCTDYGGFKDCLKSCSAQVEKTLITSKWLYELDILNVVFLGAFLEDLFS
jgi:hypothetical protein